MKILSTTALIFGPSLLRNLAVQLVPLHTPPMGLDHVLLDFFSRAAAGAATVLIIIFLVGLGIPRRSEVALRRTRR